MLYNKGVMMNNEEKKAYNRAVTDCNEKQKTIDMLNINLKEAYKTIDSMQKEIDMLRYSVSGENTYR